jgi:hypothetical protein
MQVGAFSSFFGLFLFFTKSTQTRRPPPAKRHRRTWPVACTGSSAFAPTRCPRGTDCTRAGSRTERRGVHFRWCTGPSAHADRGSPWDDKHSPCPRHSHPSHTRGCARSTAYCPYPPTAYPPNTCACSRHRGSSAAASRARTRSRVQARSHATLPLHTTHCCYRGPSSIVVVAAIVL